MKKQAMIVFAALSIFAIAGCVNKQETSNAPVISVTNSWLASAVRDIAGDDITIKHLLPPGSCPGHFDISPREIKRLKQSRILFRFHFQQGLDQKLSRLNLKTHSITAPEGLSVPESYLIACREICIALSQEFPQKTSFYQQRLQVLEMRMEHLTQQVRREIESNKLIGLRVISSRHQACFCAWLGLEIVARYSGADSTSISEIQKAIKAGEDSGIRLIVANKQEGPQAAHALGQRLKAPLAMLSNFPCMAENERTFEQLVINNTNRIIKAAAQ
jgi:ABC-type Zn uptake system ZnuABC Zn-binding protein ZnuA